ncbi:MAG: hypothetical protein E7001_03935 [Coriobacteriaceae bacterium]|nr:hypothetical protein [Coriobacteriaceae bacterium]
MYRIGEHLIHPGQGVCTVMGFEDAPAPMIVLEAKAGHARTRMRYPLSQADRLHACITHDEAEQLLEHYADLECDPFTERNSSLEESYFKGRIKQGAPDTVCVAKTMRSRIEDALRRDKRPSSYYTRIFKEAHRRAVEELAVALGVSEDAVAERLDEATGEASVN